MPVRKIDTASSAHRGVILACAVGGLAGLMLAGCGSAQLTTAAGDGRVPGSPVPVSAIPRLRSIANSFVRGDSLITPAWVSVVTTSHEKALAAAAPTEEAVVGVGNVTVYLMTMKGRFVALPVASPLPPGKGPLTGSYLSVVVDAKTFQVVDLGLGTKPPPALSGSLGPVMYLMHLAGPQP
jgi:hypothetical protein